MVLTRASNLLGQHLEPIYQFTNFDYAFKSIYQFNHSDYAPSDIYLSLICAFLASLVIYIFSEHVGNAWNSFHQHSYLIMNNFTSISFEQEPFKSLPLIWTIHERSLATHSRKYISDGQTGILSDWKRVFNRSTVVVFPNYVLPVICNRIYIYIYFLKETHQNLILMICHTH